jgi:hypothetical protein
VEIEEIDLLKDAARLTVYYHSGEREVVREAPAGRLERIEGSVSAQVNGSPVAPR